jgi:hypothetical protein
VSEAESPNLDVSQADQISRTFRYATMAAAGHTSPSYYHVSCQMFDFLRRQIAATESMAYIAAKRRCAVVAVDEKRGLEEKARAHVRSFASSRTTVSPPPHNA